MSEPVVLTVLVENSVQDRALMAEHGLAFHLQAGAHSLLFDTGQTDLLLHNALKLGISLGGVEAIALSHGHHDHTGGLKPACDAAPKARLFLHPAALSPKFARSPDGTSRSLGMSDACAQTIRTRPAPVVWTAKPTEVLRGIFVTGEIPRRTAFEDTGGPFFRDAACAAPDLLLDDQALFFDSLDGLVVLLGCAHAGVVNTLRCIQQFAPGRPICALLGGMHLLLASAQRMTQTVAALRELNLHRVGPAHCTGIAPAARLCAEFPNARAACHVGSRFVFQR